MDKMIKNEKDLLGYIIEVLSSLSEKGLVDLETLGGVMFELQSVHGLPASITASLMEKQYKLDRAQMVIVIQEYLSRMLDHKRAAGAEKSNIVKQRQTNLKQLLNYINTGDFDL